MLNFEESYFSFYLLLKYHFANNLKPNGFENNTGLSDILVVNISGDRVELINFGVVGKIRLRELDEVLLFNLNNILIINVSRNWIELVNLSVVWEIGFVKLNELN